MKPRIVILGVGNLLRSDDGVGVHAAQALADDPPGNAEVVDAGTDVLSALPFLENASHALIIDALRAGGEPGEIRVFRESDIACSEGARTAHAVNILSARHLMTPGSLWPEIAILGVEPARLDYGLSLSPAVAASLPQLVRRCREVAASWSSETLHQQGIPA